MLVVENISKKYGARWVVKSFSMKVERGEIVALLGPNGAGKTTSFCMIAGIVAPNSGRIVLNNIDITKSPLFIRSRLGLSYLPQEASIFRKMTVEDNIQAALEIHFNNKEIINKKLEDLLDDLHIQHIRKSLGGVLSGGERRRVEVARILAIEPTFILLDEPFAGIDPIAVKEIKQLINKLASKKIGILITDHNVFETLKAVDRAYIIYNGEVIKHGTPNEIAADENVKNVYLGEDFAI
jgi:lipopolysaccharide export system ATP-binding protein